MTEEQKNKKKLDNSEIIAKLILLLEEYRQLHYLDGVKVYFQNEDHFTIKGIRNINGESKVVCCSKCGKENFDLKNNKK